MNFDLRSVLFLTLLLKKTYETLSYSTQLPLISSTKQLTLNDSTNEFDNEFMTSSEVITVNEIYNKRETYDNNTLLALTSTKSHKKFHRKKHNITNSNKNEDNEDDDEDGDDEDEDDNESTTIARAVPTLKAQAFQTTASTIKPIIGSEVNKTGTDSKPTQVKPSENLNINKTESNPNPANAFITIKPVDKLPKTKPHAKKSKTKPNIDVDEVNFPIIDEIDDEIKYPLNPIFNLKTRTPFTFSTSSHTFINSKFNCDLNFCQIECEKIGYFESRCSGFARFGWLSCNCGLCVRSLCRTSCRVKHGLNSRFSGCYKGFCLC